MRTITSPVEYKNPGGLEYDHTDYTLETARQHHSKSLPLFPPCQETMLAPLLLLTGSIQISHFVMVPSIQPQGMVPMPTSTLFVYTLASEVALTSQFSQIHRIKHRFRSLSHPPFRWQCYAVSVFPQIPQQSTPTQTAALVPQDGEKNGLRNFRACRA